MTTRLDSFAVAITRLREALSAPVTDLTRDASIKWAGIVSLRPCSMLPT
jgi:hypothetical protein